MSIVTGLIPLPFIFLVWALIYKFNLKKGWFRTGEIIFWDVMALIFIYLLWLRWF